MSTGVTELVVEQAALAWFESVGWSVRHGAEIAPGELAAKCSDYGHVVLEQQRDALGRLNRGLPAKALDDAFRKLTRPDGVELSMRMRNRVVHRLFVDGVTVVIDPRRPAHHAAAQAHLRRAVGEGRGACVDGYAGLTDRAPWENNHVTSARTLPPAD